jgi:hypothetical protein
VLGGLGLDVSEMGMLTRAAEVSAFLTAGG